MDKKIFEKIIDNLIDEAKPQIVEKINSEEIEDVPEIKFSEEHNKKMEQIFSMAREMENRPKKHKIAKKIAILVAAVILISGIAISSVGAWRESFIKYFLNIKDEYSEVIYNKFNDGNTYTVDNIYFGYIPNEYGLESKKEFKTGYMISFIYNDEGEINYINFNLNNNSIWSASMNSESGDFAEYTINGNDMVYTENNGIKVLTWNYNNMLYSLSSNGDKDELLKVAEKLKIRDE